MAYCLYIDTKEIQQNDLFYYSVHKRYHTILLKCQSEMKMFTATLLRAEYRTFTSIAQF